MRQGGIHLGRAPAFRNAYCALGLAAALCARWGLFVVEPFDRPTPFFPLPGWTCDLPLADRPLCTEPAVPFRPRFGWYWHNWDYDADTYPTTRYEAYAEIVMLTPEQAKSEPRAVDAQDIVSHLGPIVQPPPPPPPAKP